VLLESEAVCFSDPVVHRRCALASILVSCVVVAGSLFDCRMVCRPCWLDWIFPRDDCFLKFVPDNIGYDRNTLRQREGKK
jgi:hypothetical protein